MVNLVSSELSSLALVWKYAFNSHTFFMKPKFHVHVLFKQNILPTVFFRNK
jgi:hypothetical protein